MSQNAQAPMKRLNMIFLIRSSKFSQSLDFSTVITIRMRVMSLDSHLL